MKISLNWLKEYLPLDISPEEVSALLTGCGLEVEGMEEFESVKGSLKGVVIGEILDCEKHPNADKLSLTRVDIGKGDPLHIVCGAANVARGQKVLIATEGTVLYSSEKAFEIKKTTIRGEMSEGMICAEDELGLGTSHAGIMVLPDSAKAGMAASEYFNIYHDTVFEIGLTPNRPDAASHYGVARDLRAVLRAQMPDKYSCLELRKPSVDAFVIDRHEPDIPAFVLNPEACPRYSGLTISGIQVGESPQWLKNYLSAAGFRPINNIVDITNFVQLELGQPLHAFDASAIRGGKVMVRTLDEGTTFTTLDGVDRKLSSEDLMICDAEGGMCIGGVYGGLNSGVTAATTSIFLESACFNPVYIRKTSKRHGLKTDASFRFERGTDPENTVYALKRAAMLIREIAGGMITSEIKDVYPRPRERKNVGLRYARVNRLIGKEIPKGVIHGILTDLEIDILDRDDDGLLLAIPKFKVDVTREADVIEEILRIYGYNNVETRDEISFSMVSTPVPDMEKLRNAVADRLSGLGLHEIMCNSLTRSDYKKLSRSIAIEQWVDMLNPLSRELDCMRPTLLFGALETVLHNQNRKKPDMGLYEFGNIYLLNAGVISSDVTLKFREEEKLAITLSGYTMAPGWYAPGRQSDIYYLKALVNQVLAKLGVSMDNFVGRKSDSDYFAGGQEYRIKGQEERIAAELGEVKPGLLKFFDIRSPVFFASLDWGLLAGMFAKKTIQYRELPRFPDVRRDLALLLDKSIPFASVEAVAFDTEPRLLKEIGLFDIYEGEGVSEGKKSYAVSFTIRDEEKTLRDEEIDDVMSRLIIAFKNKLNALIR